VTRHFDTCRSAAFAVATGLLALAAPAAAQTTEFRGGGFVSDFTAPCATDGWGPPNQIVARMRPAGQPGNPANSSILNLFFDSFTMHFAFPSAAAGTWVTTTGAASIGGGFTVQTSPQPQIRLLDPPAGTTFTTDERHVVAEILHFGAVQNCQARVNLWLFRR
jgi:hypothetical protein